MASDTIINEKNSGEVNMKANTVEQVNVNHQSNMTLCAHSIITQSNIRVDIAYRSEYEPDEVSGTNEVSVFAEGV